MKASRIALACVVVLMLAGVRGVPAQSPPAPPSIADAACGAADAIVKSKRDKYVADLVSAPAGKAIVYVIEQMPDEVFLTTHVNVGADGRWLARLEHWSYTSVVVDPGVHHFCATYLGKAAAPETGPTMLHRVQAEAGKTYYLVYRAVLLKDGGEMGFFNLVDEDEGRYLLESSTHMTSTVTKKK